MEALGPGADNASSAWLGGGNASAAAGAAAAAGGGNASLNATAGAPEAGAGAGGCLEWEAAQHSLFQTANIFFAAAFLAPRSFKQSLLLLRALLSVGFFLAALWAGLHVCSPDVFAWNSGLALLNALHAALLAARHLPPPLSLELAELYLKLFKPLRVSRQHFKELTREGQVLRLAPGDTYAVEEVTAADERLSVLLRGRLRVTCDDTHLHYISPHQFIDSPEWEANHDTSDDVFQVTITAEQECVYVSWPRMKLERVLRHRPLLKTVLHTIIGKDITHKLYSLNEQLALAGAAAAAAEAAGALAAAARPADHWRRAMSRSLSVDAVHTGARGHVRSLAWRHSSRRRGPRGEPLLEPEPQHPPKWCSPSRGSTSAAAADQFGSAQRWAPVVTASHFPPTSPFAGYVHPPPVAAPPPPSAARADAEVTELVYFGGATPPPARASMAGGAVGGAGGPGAMLGASGSPPPHQPLYQPLHPRHHPLHTQPAQQLQYHNQPQQQIGYSVPWTHDRLHHYQVSAPAAGASAGVAGTMAGMPAPVGGLPPPINTGPARQRSLLRREVKFETPPV